MATIIVEVDDSQPDYLESVATAITAMLELQTASFHVRIEPAEIPRVGWHTLEVPTFWHRTWPGGMLTAGDLVKIQYDQDGNTIDIDSKYAELDSDELTALEDANNIAPRS